MVKNDNVLWLQGGLGNQLFQVNAAEQVSTRIGCDLRVSRASYTRDRLRSCALPSHSLSIDYLSLWEELLLGRPYARHGELKLAVGGRSIATDISQIDSAGKLIVGFFQDADSLALSTSSLVHRLRALRVSVASSQRALATRGRPVLHVRRGDYVTSAAAAATFGTVGFSYYLDALRDQGYLLKDAVVYTDDPAYVVDVFGIDGSRVFGPSSEYSDIDTLLCMSLAGTLVIPNSTFSWWAAEVAGPGVSVTAPETWFLDHRKGYTLARPSWFKVNNGAGQ